MLAEQTRLDPTAPVQLDVARATVPDLRAAIFAGLHDFRQRPALSLSFGLIFALFGLTLLAGLVVLDQIWITIAAAVGFPLVAPFLAAGLYEMSRRFSRGESFRTRDIFRVIFDQSRREFGWMAFIMLFVFWIWAYQVRIVLAVTMQYQGFRSLDHLITAMFTTGEGVVFLAIGTVIGGVLSIFLFTITVISMPLLLDKKVDFVTAMITSVRSVLNSPRVMLGWGAFVGALTLVSVATLFVGVIFVVPVLGHASWHLYERLVSERDAAAPLQAR